MAKQRLKNGYTTGTCAAAAAKAAAVFRAVQKELTQVTLMLPGGQVLRIPVTREESGGKTICFSVKKDSGDDPDVTNGTLVYADIREVSPAEFQSLCMAGTGYVLDEFPNLYLNGGQGIGMVTKPGLSCPVGHYAINPVPRGMILGAVDEIFEKAAVEGFFVIRIRIPDGEQLALQTFNPKLGIEGGISVLGTTGIVKPMSEEALLETIRLEIHMKAVNGAKILLMAPGNYGEEFLKKQLGVPVGSAVLCSNFVKAAVQMAAEEGVSKLLFVGHIGKLIKVSAGVENTHSKYGDGRMEQMAVLAGELGHPELGDGIRACNTTDDALELLKQQELAEEILNLTAAHVKHWIECWGKNRLSAEVVTFSTAHQILGSTKNWQSGFFSWKAQRGEPGYVQCMNGNETGTRKG